MKKYKLLKDLPLFLAGVELKYNTACSTYELYDVDNKLKYSFTAKEISYYPEWFEEVKPDKIEFIHELFNKTKKWINPNIHPVRYSWEYLQSQFAGGAKIAIPDFEALAKELYTKDEMFMFGYEIYDLSNPPELPHKKVEAVKNIFENWEKKQ